MTAEEAVDLQFRIKCLETALTEAKLKLSRSTVEGSMHQYPNERGGYDDCTECARAISGACYGHGHR